MKKSDEPSAGKKVRTLQDKSSQVKSSQVKSSQVKSSQVKSSQVKSSQVKSSQVKSSQEECLMAAAIRVLYVDDEPDLLSIGKLFLEESGDFTVTTAMSATEGIRLLEQEKFDAIISDYQMPGMDGVQFLVEVRTRFGSIPFILFTGRGREEIVIQAINSGADFYLQKGGEPGAQFAELSHKVKAAASSKRADDLLRKSEEKYRMIDDASIDYIYSYDMGGHFTSANRSLCTAMMLRSDQILGRTHAELGFPDAQCRDWDDLHRKVYNTGATVTSLTSTPMPDGSIRQYEVVLNPLHDNQGMITGISGTTRDITDRKRAEDALRTLAEGQYGTDDDLLRALVRQLALSQGTQYALVARIYQDDPGTAHTLAVWAGSDFGDNFRYSLDGTPCENVSVKGTCLYSRDIRQLFPRDQILADMNAESYWGTPLRDNLGQTIGILAMLDVKPMAEQPQTLALLKSFAIRASQELQRMQAEETLRNREEYYRTILQTTKDGFWIIDTHTGRFLDVNETYCEMSGYSKAELLEMGINDIDSLEDPAKTQERIRRILSNGSEIFETHHRRKDGSTFAVEISVTYFPTGGGKFICFCRDITRRKRADEALKESEERFRGLVDTITSGVAIYEVKNNGVSGKDYIIKDFNKKALEIEGKKKEEVVGKSLFDLRPAIDDYGLIAVFKRVWETGVPAYFPQKVYVDEKYSNWYENRVFRLQSGEIVAVYDDITERKVAEETLRNREEYYRTILQTTKDGFWIIDAHSGRFIDVNETYCAMSGYAKAEILMMGINDIDSIEDPVKTQERIERILTNGYELFETRHTRKDGSLFDAGISVTYFPGEGGKFICFCRDITERKLADEALQETNEYLNNLFDYANAPIIVWDPNFVITRFNHAFEDLTLISAQEIIGQRLDLLFPKDSRDTSLLQIKKTLEGERWEIVEIPILVKDGSIRTLLWNSANIHDPDGRIISTIAQGVDITERKRAEKDLCESEERYNSLFTNNYSISLLIDPETGKIVDANAAACKYYGYSPEQIRGMGIYEINRIVKEIVIRNLKEAKKEKERHFFSTHFLSDGRQRNVEIYSGPILVNGKTLFYSIIHDVTDRVKAEEELKNSRHFIEHTLTATPSLIYIYDVVEGRNVYTNRGIFEALGYTPEEISAMGLDLFSRILHPDDADRVGQHHARFSSLPDSTVAEIEYRMKHADGSWRWLHSRDVVFQRTPDGAVKQILGSSIDITDRKMLEEALKLKDSAIKSSINAIAIADLSGNLTDVNPAFLSIWGYEHLHEVLGRSALSFWMVPEEAQQVVDRIQAQGTWSGEMTGQRKDGTPIPVQMSANLIHDAAGMPVAMMASFIDITGRKVVEQALMESESFNRNLVENLPDYIGISAPDGKILYMNAPAMNALGYTIEEIIGTSVLSHVAEECRGDVISGMAARQKGGDVPPYEIDVLSKDGHRISVIVKGAPIRYRNSPALLLVLSDITERKRAEEALHQANKKLNLLSSITRHDINNQLTGLRGYLAILKKKQPDPQFTEYFQKINISAQRISAMIQFTREYESIGVNAPAWQDCRILVDTAAKETSLGKVLVKNDLPAGAEMFTDPLIVKVFYNMMDNAVRYGGKITSIRFSVEERESDYVVVCEDDGDGVVAEEKEKIFVRGFGNNTGMGLFLSREILSITGITIRETGEPGKGARFEMTVPKAAWRVAGKNT